jgi:hypothetical protein
MSDRHEHEFKVVCPLVENPELYHYMKALPETTKRTNRLWWGALLIIPVLSAISIILALVK